MVTVFCDEFGLAASATSLDEALDRLKQTIISYSHALERAHLWHVTLKKSRIDWQWLRVPCKLEEVVLDV